MSVYLRRAYNHKRANIRSLAPRENMTAIIVFPFVAVLILAFPVVRAELEVVGTLIDVIPTPLPSPRFWRADDDEDSTDSPSCAKRYGPLCGDCNTLWVTNDGLIQKLPILFKIISLPAQTCVGNEAPLKVQNCEETYPGRPLCENNACTATLTDNSTCATQLQCTGQGYFPSTGEICLRTE